MATISSVKLNIARKLKDDKDFRKRFFRGQTQDEIAMSIRSLREERKMRQIDLARESRMKQSAISRIEQADYSSWSFNTLLRVADALDARLRVTLEPAEIVIDRYEEKEVAASTGLEQTGEFHFSNAMTPEIDMEHLLVPPSVIGRFREPLVMATATS
jgi:transcriptional regulator with XRE-family HTH domain